MRTFVFNREKFKRLVHYVIWRAGDRPGFGAVKLNKVLWFADARAYTLRGKPITGAVYVRQRHEPVPKAFLPIREDLVQEGAIRVVSDKRFDMRTTRFKALKKPDTGLFAAEELKDVDYWIKHIDAEHTAASISEQSHDYAWEIAAMGEELPYHAVFANRIRQPNQAEKASAKKRARELGLL